MASIRSVTCPHCDSTNVTGVDPVSRDSRLTWYSCTDCGRLFSEPIAEPTTPLSADQRLIH